MLRSIKEIVANLDRDAQCEFRSLTNKNRSSVAKGLREIASTYEYYQLYNQSDYWFAVADAIKKGLEPRACLTCGFQAVNR